MTDNFLQNKSVLILFRRKLFQVCNFFQAYIDLYEIEENNTLHVNSLFKLVPTAAFFSIEALARAVQSAMSTRRRCFCNLVIARATSLKCKNKQLLLLLKRRKVNLRCARWSIFTYKNRLKINAEAVLKHLHLKNFLRCPNMLGCRFSHFI